MRNFVLGVIATIGALAVGNKIYEKGYNEAMEDSKTKKESSKKKEEK